MAGVILVSLLLGVASFGPPSGLPPEGTSPAPTFQVLYVPDGDSVVLKDSFRTPRVWLFGVAEPATDQPKGCALLRTRFLRSLLEGQAVRARYEPGREPGRGGRIRAHLYRASDGLWVNLEVISRGYGAPSGECPPRLRERFGREESRARLGLLGVWSPPTLATAQAECDREDARKQAQVDDRRSRRLEAAVKAREEAAARRSALEQEVARRRKADIDAGLLDPCDGCAGTRGTGHRSKSLSHKVVEVPRISDFADQTYSKIGIMS
jgi:endonuclease YncB( thermonuclease family)